MIMTQVAGRAVLTVGVAVAFASLAAAPSRAADGNEHPLRGDFPPASAAAAPAHPGGESARILEMLPTKVRQTAGGDWLRGDLPRAVAGRQYTPSAMQTAASVDSTRSAEAAELRPTKLDAADAPLVLTASLGPGATKTDFICRLAEGELSSPAILRVFHLAAE